MRALSASCVLLLLTVAGCSRNTDPQPPIYSRASVIVEQSQVTPGSRVNFGIQFVMDEGWHTYWQNPGDSGEPARINWQLPAGMTAGTIEWPTPIRLTTSAGTDYGYEGTTVLLSSLQVPADAQPGQMQVTGDLTWLVCREVCVPQRTQLNFPIRVSQTTTVDASAQQLLRSAAERLPKPLPRGLSVAAATTTDGFRLTLQSKDPISKAHFFPGREEQVDNAAPQELTTRAGKTSLTLEKSEYFRQESERLTGVLVLNGEDAYHIEVPIQKGTKR